MAPHNVFYYSSPLHKDHFVLSFAFCFDREDERYHFALAQPYSFSRHQMYVDNLCNRNLAHVKVDILAKSVQGRPLHLITITDPKNVSPPELESAAAAPDPTSTQQPEESKDTDERKLLFKEDEENCEDKPEQDSPRKIPVVFVMARSHSSDTASSFIVQGLIDFLVSSHTVAKALRKNVIFRIAPVMNPDGVFLGNTRGNLLGQDLNRHWHDADQNLHPTVFAMREAITNKDDPRHQLDMILDLHSNTSFHGLFVYGNSYDDVYRFERHIVFPKILSQNCFDFNQENTIYNRSTEKEGTSRHYYCSSSTSEANSYTIEVSVLGYMDPETDSLVTYTDELYCKIGSNMARALWDYYKIMGAIPLDGDDRPKSASAVHSFNLLRLKEVASQRQDAARSFDRGRRDSDSDDGATTDDNGLRTHRGRLQRKSTATRKNTLSRKPPSTEESPSGSLEEASSDRELPPRITYNYHGYKNGEGIEGIKPVVTPAPRFTRPAKELIKFPDKDENGDDDADDEAEDEVEDDFEANRKRLAADAKIPFAFQWSEGLQAQLDLRNEMSSSSCSLHCRPLQIFSSVSPELRVTLTPSAKSISNNNILEKHQLQKVEFSVRSEASHASVIEKLPFGSPPQPCSSITYLASPRYVRKIGGGALVIAAPKSNRPKACRDSDANELVVANCRKFTTGIQVVEASKLK
jgi:hypothetical protein